MKFRPKARIEYDFKNREYIVISRFFLFWDIRCIQRPKTLKEALLLVDKVLETSKFAKSGGPY